MTVTLTNSRTRDADARVCGWGKAQVRLASALLLLLLFLPACADPVGGGNNETRISGFYILEQVDGAPVPASITPQQGCDRTVRVGHLSLSPGRVDLVPMYDWTIIIDADCQPVPAGVFVGEDDVGSWRFHPTQLSLRSMTGLGEYAVMLEEVAGGPPFVTLAYLGNSYRFKRIDEPTAVVFVKVIDHFGQPVAGVVLDFAVPYGLPRGGTTPASGEFGTSGHAGEWRITMRPPAGYEVPASQPNPFTVTAVEDQAQRVTVTLTKL